MAKEQIIKAIEEAEIAFSANPNDVQLATNLSTLIFEHPQEASQLQRRKNKDRKGWAKPYHQIEESKIKSPGSLTALKRLMREIGQTGKKLKAVGSGYAFSNVLETEDWLVSLKKLKKIYAPKKNWLKQEVIYNDLIEIQAGVIIDSLNKKLWKIGKTLLNQPGYEHLNFFGVATTGGHGSGLGMGPIAAAIRSINVLTLTEEGKLKEFRIEPTNGITFPTTFNGENPNIELIQNDDIFYASTVSMGCLGIVHSLIIETEERYFLQEERVFVDWANIKPNIMQQLNDPSIHSIHIWFNPYRVNGNTDCVVSRYTIHQGPPKRRRPIGMSWNIVDELSPALELIMRIFPKKVPELISKSLEATKNKRPVIMRNYKAINFGPPNHSKVHATNFSIPINRTIELVEAMHNFFEERAKDRLFVTAPIGFRFTASGNAWLSPQFNRQSCMVELPILDKTPGALDTIEEFQEFVVEHFEARPHWGQLNPIMNKDLLKQMYPQWKKFVLTFHQFNKGHFDNKFTEQLGLRELINEIQA